jgi:hypothetical protein
MKRKQAYTTCFLLRANPDRTWIKVKQQLKHLADLFEGILIKGSIRIFELRKTVF